MNDNNRNLILAILLSGIVLFGWQFFVAMPQMEAEQARQAVLNKETKKKEATAKVEGPAQSSSSLHLKREDALKQGGQRVAINTPTVDGSLRLTGARFDDLRLKNYRETTDPNSPEIVLFAPQSTTYPYYAQFGWLGQNLKTPGKSSVWKLVSGTVLSPGKPVTLEWENGEGLVFRRVVSIDTNYMFTVVDTVRNNSNKHVVLAPYASVTRDDVPYTQHFWVLHEGFVGVANDTLQDATYDEFKTDGQPPERFSSTGGWVGITDKYWMAALVPPQKETFDGTFLSQKRGNSQTHTFQADYQLHTRDIAPGQSATVSHKMFAGAKVVNLLQQYEETQGISKFDLAVDWGWFWFITKPLFLILDYFFKLLGNFGLAILLLTVVVKLVFYPLADTSYKSMSRMKKVQPEMERIKQRAGDDKMKMQQEMMELYKREKVNPLSGCLPILIQIPVFFSLYKVLFVTIEMRHAPFYGWINDLSAPDPTSIFNFFGLFPWSVEWVPVIFAIGIWPILMGITQWVQMKLNPAPADPVQAQIFNLMPFMFVFMFATFPAGLVIYYTWNNILGIAQQWLMMKREGVPVHLFENLKLPGAKKEKMPKAAND